MVEFIHLTQIIKYRILRGQDILDTKVSNRALDFAISF